MADMNSPPQAFTVTLPAGLIEELKAVARYRGVPLDELVKEACAAYAEPYVWEEAYVEWRRKNPAEPAAELGIDGRPLPVSGKAS
jgi:hypothetical protein